MKYKIKGLFYHVIVILFVLWAFRVPSVENHWSSWALINVKLSSLWITNPTQLKGHNQWYMFFKVTFSLYFILTTKPNNSLFLTKGQFHQHTCISFLDQKNLLANGVWQTVHRFGKWRTNSPCNRYFQYCSIYGKIEWHFFAMHRQHFGEIDPCSQFHQYLISRFGDDIILPKKLHSKTVIR